MSFATKIISIYLRIRCVFECELCIFVVDMATKMVNALDPMRKCYDIELKNSSGTFKV